MKKFDTSKQRIIRVIGHKNPDTDSICSAIGYAYLKNQISDQPHEPRRAGEISRETQFVLDHFGVPVPKLSVDMSPTISYIDIRQEPGVDGMMSTRDAWQLMNDHHIDTLCITTPDDDLEGLITVKDIANANMDLFHTEVLADSKTPFKNLLGVLNGKMLTGDPAGAVTTGQIHIGTSPEAMEELIHPGDLVMVTNRYEAQMCAIDYGASYLIVCMDSAVPQKLIERAAAANCTVIQTPYDTYAASRLVSMAVPIRYFMRTDGLMSFNVDTPVEEARKVMASVRHRYFPILDRDNKYVGVISRRNLLNMHRKKVILVDHNERSQAVDGLEEAEILEVIDHHRIGTLETSGPVYFRNEPVGCTATILHAMFAENNVEIPKHIAGLLLSAILSDTLMFHSPTCTLVDKAAAADLAKICGEDIQEYGEKMFEAGEDLTGRDADDVLHTDFKEFNIGDTTISVGQGFYMSGKAYHKAGQMVLSYLPEAVKHSGSSMIFYMLTAIQTQDTELLYVGKGAGDLVAEAFHVQPLPVNLSESGAGTEDITLSSDEKTQEEGKTMETGTGSSSAREISAKDASETSERGTSGGESGALSAGAAEKKGTPSATVYAGMEKGGTGKEGKAVPESAVDAMEAAENYGHVMLRGVVSRKKQLIPPLRDGLLG